MVPTHDVSFIITTLIRYVLYINLIQNGAETKKD